MLKLNPKKEESEEENGKAGSLLKDLLTQKHEASKKANEALKKIEAEGAKAFHEHRMKAEKAPYHEKKNADEYKAWSEGWFNAAQELKQGEEKVMQQCF